MSAELREWDVIRYDPPQHHCYEGMAIARGTRDGELVLWDTYWSCDRKPVNPESWVLLFNIDDYVHVSLSEWERFAKADREVVTSQHGLSRQYYVRKGAKESQEQIIANAREALGVAEEKVRSAEFQRDCAQRHLDQLTNGDPS